MGERKVIRSLTVKGTSSYEVDIIADEVDYNGNSDEVYFGKQSAMPDLWNLSDDVVLREGRLWDPRENCPVPWEFLEQGVGTAFLYMEDSFRQDTREFPDYFAKHWQEIDFGDPRGRQYFRLVLLLPYVKVCRKYDFLADGIVHSTARGKKTTATFYSSLFVGKWWIYLLLSKSAAFVAIMVAVGLGSLSNSLLVALSSLAAAGGVGFLKFLTSQNRERSNIALWQTIEEKLQDGYQAVQAQEPSR